MEQDDGGGGFTPVDQRRVKLLNAEFLGLSTGPVTQLPTLLREWNVLIL